MRTEQTFTVANARKFKEQLLFWSKNFNEAIFLDSNSHQDPYGSFDALLAVSSHYSLVSSSNSFHGLQELQEKTKDWLFGYLSYDLKNELEDLKSENYDGLGFPELYFFQPKKIIRLEEDKAIFLYLDDVESDVKIDLNTILNTVIPSGKQQRGSKVKIKLRIQKDAYYNKANQFLKHIHRGDIYEANFCQEFYAEETQIAPITTYLKLNGISKTPLATFLKFDNKYLLSATPERYLKKIGAKIISQPIKGTAPRSPDIFEDIRLKTNLEEDVKERSENIMITDLVRNDLSKIAKRGSVEVAELCKVYTFEQVHQMISTIRAEVDLQVTPVEVLKATFPMGSMTGAPKIAALKIIEELEETKRGLYSGAVGYFTPDGDFDFNVVIRSILYNEAKKYVSYSVGSAITEKSYPEKEYQECLLKAKAMRKVLENN